MFKTYIFDKTKFRIIPVFLNIINLWISVGKNGQAKTFRVFLIDFKITEISLTCYIHKLYNFSQD